MYFPFFILHDWDKRSVEARSSHLSGVALKMSRGAANAAPRFDLLQLFVALTQTVHIIQSASGIVVLTYCIHVCDSVGLFLLRLQAVHIVQSAGAIVILGNTVHVIPSNTGLDFLCHRTYSSFTN